MIPSARIKSLHYLPAIALILAIIATGCPKPPPPPPAEKVEIGVPVTLAAGAANASPEDAKLSTANGNDHVRWSNETSKDITLKFTVAWPFLETQADIVIPAGKKSEWYSLDPVASIRSYPYHVDPPLSGIPPSEPKITAEP